MLTVEERMDVRVEVQEQHVLLVLPRRMDDLVCFWEQADSLGRTMQLAAAQVPSPPAVVNWTQVVRETGQVKVGVHGEDRVALFFGHTDRLSFSPEAAKIVGRAICLRAQDQYLLQKKKVKATYGRGGMVLKAIYNLVSGLTQKVR